MVQLRVVYEDLPLLKNFSISEATMGPYGTLTTRAIMTCGCDRYLEAAFEAQLNIASGSPGS